jgi:hypothetical protein
MLIIKVMWKQLYCFLSIITNVSIVSSNEQVGEVSFKFDINIMPVMKVTIKVDGLSSK